MVGTEQDNMREFGETAVRLQQVCKYYKIKSPKLFQKPGILKAVDHVDLDIRKGEILGLVGESGCGKSTLGCLAVRMLRPTGGSVSCDGYEGFISTAQMKDFRRKNQMIFQDPYSSLDPRKTIGWLMKEPLVIHKIGKDDQERTALAEQMLTEVGLDASYMSRYPRELSGGQRQRVCIGIAMIMEPEFVVADEPVSALDVSIQAQILNLIRSLQEKRGITWLFISHDLSVVHYISDRIGVMYLGKIVELGDVETIYRSPLHPYTKALLSAIPEVDGREREEEILEGDIPDAAGERTGCAFASRCKYAYERCRQEMPALKEIQGRQVACHRCEDAKFV